MGKVDDFIDALEYYGDGRYKYYDGSPMSIGCSNYAVISLRKAGIIRNGEDFHAASGYMGVLTDLSRFQKLQWDPKNLKRGDILWSHGHHVAIWDGIQGVYEAAPETTHGPKAWNVCDNGRTGVGHWSKHTYYNCGTGTYTWTCIFRIIDMNQVRQDIQKEAATKMDKQFNMKTLIQFLPIVQNGSTGSMVKMLQTILKKYGWYAGDIDGSCGPYTVSGIKLLQTGLGLPVDGVAGPQTWTKLLT